MEILWLLVVLVTMVVYPVFLIRAALKGKRWALEVLEAMRYVGGDATMSAWRPLPPERPRPAQVQTPEETPEPGRLVA